MENKDLKLDYLGFSNATKEDKKVFVALGADYGNIGDMAITIAQIKLIQDAFPDRKIVEIPAIDPYIYKDEILKILNDDDICTIIGGGNLGNLYVSYEEKRRFFIDIFKNNKIISFPQSIYFSNDAAGDMELQKSIDIYGSHKDLTILAREQRTYDILTSNFKNNVQLVPDIVFYLKDKLDNIQTVPRTNITLCFRNDKEKVTDYNIIEELTQLLDSNNLGNNINCIDTHIGEVAIHQKDRKNIFENCLKNFINSKVILTDRLHGMIFSIITNTPCIAFNNSNKKISSTYATWLKNIPQVKFIENYDEEKILEYIKELSNIENPKIEYDKNLNFEKIFETLKA